MSDDGWTYTYFAGRTKSNLDQKKTQTPAPQKKQRDIAIIVMNRKLYLNITRESSKGSQPFLFYDMSDVRLFPFIETKKQQKQNADIMLASFPFVITTQKGNAFSKSRVHQSNCLTGCSVCLKLNLPHWTFWLYWSCSTFCWWISFLFRGFSGTRRWPFLKQYNKAGNKA